MGSPYGISGASNGNNGAISRILTDALKVLVPIIMAAYAIYQNNVTGHERDEATKVDVERMKHDVETISKNYISRDEVKDLLQPLREASTDERATLRDMEKWIRDQAAGRVYGRQQPN